MKKLFGLLLIMLPFCLLAQDYVMWETQYLKPKAGHYAQLMEKLADHNQTYHQEGAASAYVFFINTGPRAGQLSWVMGPCTFTDFDDRGGQTHFLDWFDGVMSHCDDSEFGTELWRRSDDLSYMPETDGEDRPLQMVRYFEVADNELFGVVQKQIRDVITNTPGYGEGPRVMYRKRGRHEDSRDWAMVRSYKNWASLDADDDGPEFREAFIAVHGEAAWETFTTNWDKAVLSREDEWRSAMVELHGPQPEENDK